MSDDKDSDLAIAVHNDRRAEIRDRLGYRDQWISRYVFGVVAFLGVSLGIDSLDPDSAILLCLVMPVVSWIVALNVSAHVRGVENNANYLRGTFNDFLIDRGIWVPHWEWQVSVDRLKADPREHRRTRRRRWTNLLSLHFPSGVSLLVASALLAQHYDFSFRWPPSLPLPPIMFVVACGFVIAAIRETLNSFDDRENNTVKAKTPPAPVAPAPAPTAPPPAPEAPASPKAAG